MGNLTKLWTTIDGQKTHLTAGIGILLILSHHFLGWNVPGVTYDDANWSTQIYTLLMVMCGRDALRKMQ